MISLSDLAIWCCIIHLLSNHIGLYFLYLQILYLVQVQLRTEVLHIPSSPQLGFERMTSISWEYLSCHWDAYSNHSAISDFKYHYFKYGLGQKYSCYVVTGHVKMPCLLLINVTVMKPFPLLINVTVTVTYPLLIKVTVII